MQKFLTGILILLLTRFLDKVSAQHLYFLALEHELLDTNDLSAIKISSFYVLKGFWNIFWWFLFITSIILSVGYMFASRSIDEELSDSEPEDDDDSKETIPSKSKRPTRASKRYKSKRYEV